MKTNFAQLTYEDESAVMTATARNTELQLVKSVYDDFSKAASEVESNSILAANKAREIGLHLVTLYGGKEQIKFSFWKENFEGKLPFSFEDSKRFIAVSKRMQEPAKTLAEAVEHLQLFLGLEAPSRAEAQHRATLTMIEIFTRKLTLLQTPWQKALIDKPMESWNRTALKQFIFESEWLIKECDRAKSLLEKL